MVIREGYTKKESEELDRLTEEAEALEQEAAAINKLADEQEAGSKE